MRPILDDRIFKKDEKFHAVCACGSERSFADKSNALKMLSRGTCQACRPQHSAHQLGDPIGIFKNPTGKWVCHCSGCGKEQAYTRKDHAKQSLLNDWQCKVCTAQAKGFSKNRPVGDQNRMFNRFKNSAADRNLEWALTKEMVFAKYSGFCAMTGWPISLAYTSPTASLDRIDSKKGYVLGNIQWVHKMVNMCKNKYTQQDFVAMCNAVSKTVTQQHTPALCVNSNPPL